MGDLDGRVAVVTGASGGIGRATASELARRGAAVAVHYRGNAAGAQETMGVLGSDARHAMFGADLTHPDEVRGLFGAVERTLGPVDILVNNAGDLIERRPLLEMPEALWHDVLNANVTTAFLCTQVAARGMVERRRGAIVNLASLAAHNGGGPGAFAYAAAKGAIVSMTKGLAKELAPFGVRVNCVSPGLIDNTAFHGRYTPRDAFQAAAKTIPLGRAGEPDDVARVIGFLCSDDSSFLAGETIEVNGGMFMR